MLRPERPDRIDVIFDDHRLVANAGLVKEGGSATTTPASGAITRSSP